MLLKNILAAFTIAGLAAASPAGDIEARSSTNCATGTPFCCATAFQGLSIFFIKGVGSNCVKGTVDKTGLLSCSSSGHTAPLCCGSGNQIQDPKTGNVVCF